MLSPRHTVLRCGACTLLAGWAAAAEPSTTITGNPLITAAPELRAAAGSIIGYYPFPDDKTGPSWGTASCPPEFNFATAYGGYGACCNSPDCLFATACAGADFSGPGGAGGTCGEGNTCISYTVKWATDSPTTAFWLGCSVPPNPSVPETLYRSTWQLTTSTSNTSPKPTPTYVSDDEDFTLPPGFTMPSIPSPPTGVPSDWTLTGYSPQFPGQTGGPFLGDGGPAPSTTTSKGLTNGGDVPDAASGLRAQLGLTGYVAGLIVIWGFIGGL